MLKTVAAIAAIALLAGCGGDGGGETQTTPAPRGFEAVAGRWSGTLGQAETKPFPIEVSIQSQDDPDLNVVRYGGEIACSGNWGYAGTKAAEVIFREVIDRGRGGRCKGVGVVTLTTGEDPDRLGYAFSGGGVESEGELSRSG